MTFRHPVSILIHMVTTLLATFIIAAGAVIVFDMLVNAVKTFRIRVAKATHQIVR